jgi:hypothetical protein
VEEMKKWMDHFELLFFYFALSSPAFENTDLYEQSGHYFQEDPT